MKWYFKFGLPTNFRLVKAMVFSVVTYGCESWSVKKAEHRRIDAFELWSRRILLSVPWTARRSSQSILEDISSGVLWKDWCWSWNSNTLATWCEELTHLKRPWCWERLRAGGEGDDRGWDVWMASPIQRTLVWVDSGSWWCHPTISSSVIPFSSHLQSFPASGSFQMSQFFASGGQSIGISASACLSNEHSVLVSFKMHWLDLLAVQGTQESSPTPQFKRINSLVPRFLYSPTLTCIHDYWKNHSLD